MGGCAEATPKTEEEDTPWSFVQDSGEDAVQGKPPIAPNLPLPEKMDASLISEVTYESGDPEVNSDSSWELPGETKSSCQWHPSKSKKFFVLCGTILALGLSAVVATTARSVCVSLDPLTMEGAQVETLKKRFPLALSRSCFEGALDSCLAHFSGQVVDELGKKEYLDMWQQEGFPAIKCHHDLSNETWVSGLPKNCSGIWSDFGPCSVSCGGGACSNTFEVLHPAENGGLCPNLGRTTTKRCNEQLCPVDCELSAWTPEATGCSKLCGNGTVRETREVLKNSEHGGSCPEVFSAQRERWVPCNVDPCPVSLVEEFQETLVSTAMSIQSIQHALVSSRSLNVELLQNHPQFNCAAGITDDMKEAAAACAENNQLAKHTEEMSVVHEQVQDECGLVVPHFREMMKSMVSDLPALVTYVCSDDVQSAESTLMLLNEQDKMLLQQIEGCRTPSVFRKNF